MINKSESVNWTNVWWILGADHLTFEGVIGKFQKNISCRLISRGRSLHGYTWEKIMSCSEKYIADDVYNAEKKSYTVICQGKKF